jgi:hypothetical protein
MPERKVQQDLPPKLPSAVPPRRLGGKAKTCPLSSEESDGALSRSAASYGFVRPASSPARHSFHGLKSVTGLVAQASACVV